MKIQLFSDPGETVSLGSLPYDFTEKNVVYNNITDASADPAKNIVIDLDPRFVDSTNGDYRLRPNSPLIGGLESSAQSKLESQYPDGKWFDSSAAAGGDGSWATPYNDIFDTIESFSTGSTATVLVKEGDHPMNHTWRGTGAPGPVIPSKIEIIGINSNVRLTSENNINTYPMFMYSGLDDTEFFYKNIDFHINNTSGYVNRGVIYNSANAKTSLHQCKITQSSTGEIMSATIFYNPGEIELVAFEYIAVNWRSAHSDISYIFNTDSAVNAKNCTFLEPERSMLRTNHTYAKCVFLGRVNSASLFENCIFQSDIDYGFGSYSSRNFVASQINSVQMSSHGKFTNCYFFKSMLHGQQKLVLICDYIMV